jgi:hypothetical protein
MTIRLTLRIVSIENKKYKYKIVVENLILSEDLGKLGVEMRIILKCVSQKECMCRLDCPGEELDRIIGFYGHKIRPVVSAKAENFFAALSVQFSLRTFHHHTRFLVNKLHTACSEKSNRNS